MLKFTNIFTETQQRPDRKGIKVEWIEFVFTNPEYEQIQKDGRIRRWAYIREVDKYLRIIVLDDNETIHNAFFDRDYNKIKKVEDYENLIF